MLHVKSFSLQFSRFIDPRRTGLYYELMNSGDMLRLGCDDDGRRLDRILRKILQDFPLSAIHRALRKGDIRVNGHRQSPDYRCHEGDSIEYRHLVRHPSPSAAPSPKTDSIPDQLSSTPLSILLETADLLILNKPIGQLVHDGADSLDALVKIYLHGKLEASLAFTPGPLHRLDRNTSGIIAFSRSMAGARLFSEALRRGSVRKTYVALLEGKLDAATEWRDMIFRDPSQHKSFIDAVSPPHLSPTEGKEAITELFPLASGADCTLAAMKLQTGRTHQIRAQSAFHGHPLLGDLKYGGTRSARPYYLHAWALDFENQILPGLPLEINAPLPNYFLEKIRSSFSMSGNEVYSVLRQFRF